MFCRKYKNQGTAGPKNGILKVDDYGGGTIRFTVIGLNGIQWDVELDLEQVENLRELLNVPVPENTTGWTSPRQETRLRTWQVT